MSHRNFSELEAEMTPAQIAARDVYVQEMIPGMSLKRIRRARRLTQGNLGAILHIHQSAISQMERRSDMYVRTLAALITAMGGELEIRANFADGSVRVTGLVDEIAATAGSTSKRAARAAAK